jgi:hypothetical protein
MVKSGLVDRTDVSQYRLAAHFGTALLILGYTLWLLFGLGKDEQTPRDGRRSRAPTWVAGAILALIVLQLLAGALVAGLDAGFGFNTWPLINGSFVPDGLGESSPWYINLFENPLTVQFDHRMLGYTVVVATLAQLAWLALKRAPSQLIGSALTSCAACFAAGSARRVDVAASRCRFHSGLPSGRRRRRVLHGRLSLMAHDACERAREESRASERLIEIGDDIGGILKPRPRAAPLQVLRPPVSLCSSVSWRWVVEAG